MHYKQDNAKVRKIRSKQHKVAPACDLVVWCRQRETRCDDERSFYLTDSFDSTIRSTQMHRLAVASTMNRNAGATRDEIDRDDATSQKKMIVLS